MPIVTEIGCQVDTHIVDENIDKKYKWNEWELRREALMLVNLKVKRTHSTQTNLSHFRRESETQYYQAAQTGTQTRTDSVSNVPRTKLFYKGLRNDGRRITNGIYDGSAKPRKNHFNVVDLSIDLDGLPVPYGGGAYDLSVEQLGKKFKVLKSSFAGTD